jgi:hypothetical protein
MTLGLARLVLGDLAQHDIVIVKIEHLHIMLQPIKSRET